jgi:hypothetical protein
MSISDKKRTMHHSVEEADSVKKHKPDVEKSNTTVTVPSALVQCKSWREFGELVKLTPPQFERNSIKQWQHLIDLAIEKMDHTAIVDDCDLTVPTKHETDLTEDEQEDRATSKSYPAFPEGSDGLKHLAWLTANQVLTKTSAVERKAHKGAIASWADFVQHVTSESELNKLYDTYLKERDMMYAEIDRLFHSHLSFGLKCSGPQSTDFRDEDDCDWMPDIAMSYHESGQSAEEKQEEDYQAYLEDMQHCSRSDEERQIDEE